MCLDFFFFFNFKFEYFIKKVKDQRLNDPKKVISCHAYKRTI